MTFAAFDIEISNTNIPEGFRGDLFKYGPLEYAVGAVLVSGGESEFYENPHQLLGRLIQLQMGGVDIVSWNGMGFDLRVLAYATDNKTRCAELGMKHIDMMFQAMCLLGYPISLNAISKGLHLGGKVSSATNSKGEIVQVSGKLAPQLWIDGEKELVKTYLAGDVDNTLQVAKRLHRSPCFIWTSKGGKPMRQPFVSLDTVENCIAYRMPYIGWMTDPPKREDFYAWTL